MHANAGFQAFFFSSVFYSLHKAHGASELFLRVPSKELKWSVRRSWIQVLVMVGCDWAHPSFLLLCSLTVKFWGLFLAFRPRSALNSAGIKGEKETRLDGALMGGSPVHVGVGTGWPLRSLPASAILWNSMTAFAGGEGDVRKGSSYKPN